MDETNHNIGKAKILLVDDIPDSLYAIEEILREQDCCIVKALSGQDALKKIIEYEFALVLLDVQMPEMDGYETAELIHATKDTEELPIIFLTAINKEEKHIARGYKAGAVDYLFKPVDPAVLQSKVRIFLQMYYRKHNLQRMAQIDPLTGLSNRRHVKEKIVSEKKRYERNRRCFSIIMADIDNFKEVNDLFGHECGDYALIQISNQIQKNIRDHDVASRWGGEEFLIFLPETDLESGTAIAERIREEIDVHEIKWKGMPIHVTMSFGVCQYEDSITVDDCIRMADEGLYRAKFEGKNKVRTIKCNTQ
ncbi:MAG: diguanylate cyclase [Spirochaetes bacterium]|jgi:diguanylate cyclase (GGDEF)-like protein|nr:diguanylate cyclase [Spirochaetota bacterium]